MGEKRNRNKGSKARAQTVKEYVLSYQYALKALLANVPVNAKGSSRPPVVTVGRCDIWPCTDAAVVLFYRSESEVIEVRVKNPLTKTTFEFQKTGKVFRLHSEVGEETSLALALTYDNPEKYVMHFADFFLNNSDRQLSPRFQKMSIFGWDSPLPKPDEEALQDFEVAYTALGKPVHIHSSIQGKLIPSDLLISEGGFQCVLSTRDWQTPTLLFLAFGEDYYFSLHIENLRLVLRRNEHVAVLTLPDLENVHTLAKDTVGCQIMVHWNYQELILKSRSTSGETEARVSTPATSPPPSLIKWAREENLLKVFEYSSEEEFRAKVYSCLASVQEKINEGKGVSSFWDISYSGNTIQSRAPKKETDIHEHIQRMLSDQMLMASIEVVPEYPTGVGNLDFIFIGQVKDRGPRKLCVEFKHAHSRDLLQGLQKQLPLYMQNKHTRYGAYCVLWFKGEWWDSPDDESVDDFRNRLERERVTTHHPLMQGIRTMAFDLSKHTPASKI